MTCSIERCQRTQNDCLLSIDLPLRGHPASQVVEIDLNVDPESVITTVKDLGQGIPKEGLEAFGHSGTEGARGLAGMIERIALWGRVAS